MRLVSDYTHRFVAYHGITSACRVRIYEPDRAEDRPVVICSQPPADAPDRGVSVSNAAEQIAAEVIDRHKLRTPLRWIEHYPRNAHHSASNDEETFGFVAFASWELRQTTDGRKQIGKPDWYAGSYISRAGVEELVGQSID